MIDGSGRMPEPTPRKPDRPILWIIAGPNGSGKSTFYNRTDIEGWGGSVWIINPDLLTAKIVESENLDLESANLAAVRRIEHWLDASIEAYQTIGVETVLSSPKYRPLVLRAQQRGFQVRMIYLLLRSAEMQIERVNLRVSEGGHNVPEEKIRARRQRSFEELAWYAEHADELMIFDNSTGEPELVGAKWEQLLVQIRPFPNDLHLELKRAGVVPARLNNPGSWHYMKR